MISIINYNAGNIRSVLFALDRLGVDYQLTADPKVIRGADKVIFPGVGAAGSTMAHLRATGLDEVIRGLTQPVFGICVGMQLLCSHSEENDVDCLGIFPDKVKKFRPVNGEKVPHMGWNTIHHNGDSWLSEATDGEHCYYVHSYYVETGAHTVATTDYGITFSACLRKDNFYAAQFHPEKSAKAGEQILSDFLTL
ncbi:imidazole glycerol phosphate synthase subunit HisH [Lewinellaceae bacterium SD302]|nr:imidazole glycerol phosphate synthase subunit HisH [Lewinellaceae bacterium SD302]